MSDLTQRNQPAVSVDTSCSRNISSIDHVNPECTTINNDSIVSVTNNEDAINIPITHNSNNECTVNGSETKNQEIYSNNKKWSDENENENELIHEELDIDNRTKDDIVGWYVMNSDLTFVVKMSNFENFSLI